MTRELSTLQAKCLLLALAGREPRDISIEAETTLAQVYRHLSQGRQRLKELGGQYTVEDVTFLSPKKASKRGMHCRHGHRREGLSLRPMDDVIREVKQGRRCPAPCWAPDSRFCMCPGKWIRA